MADYEKIFRRAADIIDRGWCQGQLRKGRLFRQDQFCFLGALDKASTESGIPLDVVLYDAGGPMYEALRERTHSFHHSAISYNDWPGRKKEEVSSLLRDAADKFAERQEAKMRERQRVIDATTSISGTVVAPDLPVARPETKVKVTIS
jgi:hypothetical protein